MHKVFFLKYKKICSNSLKSRGVYLSRKINKQNLKMHFFFFVLGIFFDTQGVAVQLRMASNSVFLPKPPECCDYRHVLLCLA
jgi:hypothetical protein